MFLHTYVHNGVSKWKEKQGVSVSVLVMPVFLRPDSYALVDS